MTTDLVRSLARHEQVIERGLGTFVEVGTSLMAIRDDRLYRDEYVTFEAYCEIRWNLSRSRAYELMGAASTVAALSAIADTPAPATESQARELRGLPAETAAAVMREATATDEKPTAATIKQAREAVVDAPKVEAAIERYPDLDAYRDKPDRVIDIATALDNYPEEEKPVRLDALAKSAAARREGRVPKPVVYDDRPEQIFRHVNAAARLLLGYEDTVVRAADPLIADTWRQQYERTGKALLDLAARLKHPALRSVK